MKKYPVPRHVAERYGGAHNYRATHRRALRYALYWVQQARFGCAYTPTFKSVTAADEALRAAVKAASVKSWGR